MRPWSGGGIGLNLSALERNRTADCSAGYPARPEQRPSSAPQKRKRERHLMSRPRYRLYSHRAFPTSPPHRFNREYRLGDAPAVKGGCHTWDYPHFPAERRPSRQRKMRPWNGGGIGLNLSTLERHQTAGCSAGYPARPERRPSSAPQKKKTGTALAGPSPLSSVQPV